jgi:hypothetical protein
LVGAASARQDQSLFAETKDVALCDPIAGISRFSISSHTRKGAKRFIQDAASVSGSEYPDTGELPSQFRMDRRVAVIADMLDLL